MFIQENPLIAFLVPAGISMLALILAAWLFANLRNMHQAQKVVLGEGNERDVINHARALEQMIDGLAIDVGELAERLKRESRRLDDCLIYRSVVRYDAYRDLSGMQSTSICLIDSLYSGVIISSIQSRDHARIYMKEVRHGESKEQLSPEETQVLKEAMGMKAEPKSKSLRPTRRARGIG
ncbi:MAG: DUF4446 family protein [Thermoleophilia bacterium]|nr:DUF4446 family protein [Thermoleophilia bacterium]